jgi:hypothetical protein
VAVVVDPITEQRVLVRLLMVVETVRQGLVQLQATPVLLTPVEVEVVAPPMQTPQATGVLESLSFVTLDRKEVVAEQ